MQLTSTDESDLLTALYGGALDEPLWSSFLQRLRARARAELACLLIRESDDAARPATIICEGGSIEDRSRHALASLWREAPALFEGMRPDRAYTLAEAADRAGLTAPGAHADALEAIGHHGRLVRVRDPSGIDLWCLVARAGGDFPASVAALLAALAPHLRVAMRGFFTAQKERQRARISAELVQRLNFGWLILDRAGRILDLDRGAEQLLRQSGLLRRTRHGTLTTARPSADRELAEMLRAVAAGEAVRPRLVHLADEPWFDMLVVASPPAGEAAGEAPVLAIYVQGDDQPRGNRCERLVDLFNLSPKEARLALSLSRGGTIGEAAAELGLTLESARTYSKRIYQKTSTRGQADLVRLILATVIALA